MAKYAFLAAAMAAVAPLVSAQTYSSCNPLKQSGCPPKPGLNTADPVVIDFTQGANSGFAPTSGTINYNSNGAEFTINNVTDSPTLASSYLIFFGYVEATVKAAPGQGIISSFILESDDLDEIDWEVIGSQTTQAQSNYFGKGNTTTYDRGQFDAVANPQTQFHTYAVDWQPNNTTWLIDGQVVRTLQFADAVGGANYPQTPMNIRLGNWVAGNPSNAPGTIQWGGGLTNFSQAPFTMTVQSLKIINYFPAVAYSYGDNSGSFQSIKLWNTSQSDTGMSVSASVTSSVAHLAATVTSNGAGSTVTINTAGSASNVQAGIIATGSFSASSEAVVTILVSGTGNGTVAAATATAVGAQSSMTTQLSEPLSSSGTISSSPAKQTTNAGIRSTEGGMSSLAVAAFGLAVMLL